VVARFQQVRGDTEQMQNYIHRQLNVSKEALDYAFSLTEQHVQGEESIASIQIVAPPARVLQVTKESQDTDVAPTLEDLADIIQEKADSLKDRLTSSSDLQKIDHSPEPMGTVTYLSTRRTGGVSSLAISREQKERGQKGEDELKRRLLNPNGWEGFTLVSDDRSQGCGYDFLCEFKGRPVKMEVKTFLPTGIVVFTGRELMEAVSEKEDYFLVGIISDDSPESQWKTIILKNPANALLSTGKFEMQTRLQVAAASIFQF
jgi:hypothetical protein